MTEFFEFLKENWLDIAMVVVGSFALLIYVLQNRRKEIDAATLVVLQIDDLQERVREIAGYVVNGQLNETAFYESLPLTETNYWEKYKHYFVGKMDAKSVNTINVFYGCVSAIQEQQLLMKNLQKKSFYANLDALVKNEADFIVFAMKDNLETKQEKNWEAFWKIFYEKRSDFITAVNGKAFTPYIPEQIRISLETLLRSYSLLEISGSSGYNMLKKKSKRKF